MSAIMTSRAVPAKSEQENMHEFAWNPLDMSNMRPVAAQPGPLAILGGRNGSPGMIE
jgi:hypothetical protein